MTRLELPDLYQFTNLPSNKPYFKLNYDKAYLHETKLNK